MDEHTRSTQRWLDYTVFTRTRGAAVVECGGDGVVSWVWTTETELALPITGLGMGSLPRPRPLLPTKAACAEHLALCRAIPTDT